MTPPLLHLGAVTYTHNNTPYAIRAEIAFDFRDGSNLKSIRLTPFTQPESPDFVPPAIDLHLLGRWQTALASLRKRVIIELQNASVKRSDDADINPVRLELSDPPRANVAVYVLTDDMAPTEYITAGSIDQGLQPCSQALKTSFQGRTDSWSSPSRAPVARHSRVTIANAPREYEYTPIGILSNPDGPIPYDPKKKFNLFGVVIECRAPSIAKTGTLRSEVVIADESSTVGVTPGDPLKGMAVFTFEGNPKDAVPFRAIGDVIRVHRVHLKEFKAYGDGERRRSAQAKFYSSIVLWEYEGTDFLPFTTREPIKQRSAEHRISTHDRDRVRELRRWAKSYVFQHHKIPRQRLQTPTDILEATNSSPNSPWLNHQPMDVICMVEPDTYIDESDGILTFLATDGFAKGKRTPRIAVQSESMRDCDSRYSEYSFIQFCPSWKFRPVGRPAWVVLRDVTVTTRNREKVIVLHAGSRTSSIIWNSEDSPDYRNAKQRIAEIATTAEPSSQIIPATVSHGCEYAPANTTTSAPPEPSNHTARQQNPSTGHQAHNAQRQLAQQANGVHTGASQQRSSPRKRLHPDGNVRVYSSGSKQRRGSLGLVSGASGSENLSLPRISGETRARSVPLRREVTVITTNEHDDLPFSSIADMLRSHREGNKGAHRLKVTARACGSPTDVRYACKPWCKRCSKYLKVVSNRGQLECVTCNDTFSSMQDPLVSWMYSVKLVLEDSSGGRIDGWIEGKEGTALFSGLAPTNLVRDSEARRKVSKSLQAVLASKNRLDCSVKPYEYEDEQGFYRMACKIFATRLQPQYIGNDCKEND